MLCLLSWISAPYFQCGVQRWGVMTFVKFVRCFLTQGKMWWIWMADQDPLICHFYFRCCRSWFIPFISLPQSIFMTSINRVNKNQRWDKQSWPPFTFVCRDQTWLHLRASVIVMDGGFCSMSSSTEPFAVIPTLLILLHWPLQPLQSTTLNRKTPLHNKIHYFWIGNVQVKSIWVDPRLMPHLFPEDLWGKSSKVATFNQVSR